MWCSGNNDGIGGRGILVKEELYKKVVVVQRKSSRMMTMVLDFEEEVVSMLHRLEDYSAKKINFIMTR